MQRRRYSRQETCPGKSMLMLCLAVLVAALFQPHVAGAQYYEPAPRRNLLDMLFGGPRTPPPRMEPRRDGMEFERRYYRDGSIVDVPLRPKSRPQPARPATPRPTTPVTAAAPEPVAKLADARKVLVLGDFMAGGIGSELDMTFARSPGIAVETRSDVASGLVRDDHYNWPAVIPAMLDEIKPAVVVIMMGANDRQQMLTGEKHRFRTEGWFKEYEDRVAAVAALVAGRKIPLVWVGLPSFQSPSMTADAVTLNTIYRNQIEKAGGEFVDIWDGFVDEDGKFILTGSDVSGQQVRLRGADGINFTKAGKQKLAFYVEKFVRRHVGEGATPDIARLDGLPPASTGSVLLPARPISIMDPELDGGKELLGARPQPVSTEETPRDRLVQRGETGPAPAGRVDDYRTSRND